DLGVEGVEGALGGLFSAVCPGLQLEERPDLVERQARGAHVGDELEALELTDAEEAVAPGAPAVGLEDPRLLVEADRAQGVAGEAGHVAGGEQAVPAARARALGQVAVTFRKFSRTTHPTSVRRDLDAV